MYSAEFTLKPSEYFARQVYACYWFEEYAPAQMLDKIPVDNVLFETECCAPIVAEIQLHLHDVLVLTKQDHMLYEVKRAASRIFNIYKLKLT